jgi:hypothetical protein
MVAKILGAQRDFSAGEIDVTYKRNDDHPARKTGVRQCANFRILNSGSVQNRSGRRALFPETGRVDQVLLSPGNKFFICFGNGTLRVYNAAGTRVFNQAGFAWTNSTAKNVVWDVFQLSIYITFSGQVPQILTWDGAAAWSVASFAEQLVPTGESAGRKLTLFYRMSPKTVTLQPSAVSGTITVLSNVPYFVAGMVGTRVNWAGKQFTITVVNGPTNATARVNDTLYAAVNIPVVNPTFFSPGDAVIGLGSGATGIVTIIGGASIHVQLNQNKNSFANGEVIVGPNANSLNNGPISFELPNPTNIFDEEVINAYRGYPQSVFVDQGRLGFCNFPGVPSGIGWSRFGVFNDFLITAATPDDPIMELTPNKSQVLYVRPGPESNEFVFCDNAIYYIPISVTNPLKPGSVAFNLLTDDGCAQVEPRETQDLIAYVNAGGNSMKAIFATGAYQRPFNTVSLNEHCSHLITNVTAIAAPRADTTFQERYIYALNGDGTLTAGKYTTKTGQIDGLVGWFPVSGAGVLQWVSAQQSDVFFMTAYAPNGIAAVTVVEALDDTQYLDCAIPVQNVPAPFFTIGKGPLFAFANGSVTLMDQATRMMGTYLIDANGNIIPQFNGGENLLAATLVAGQPWTGVLEPFVADAQPGQDVGQRMSKRRVARLAVYVVNSTGFLTARLFSGPLTRTSPALGTIMNQRRVTAWNQDDDPTLPPPLREEAQRWRPIGRSFDPRVAIIKDTPGPLLIEEIGMESTI